MPENFNKILDKCIDSILREGVTVEDCLSRYPEYARELEPSLRLVARSDNSWTFTPDSAAKDRARQRLRNVMQELDRKEETSRARAPFWNSLVLHLKPVKVLAILSVVIIVLGTGIGTVAASGSALPGETLYPVKRAAERVRLAIEITPAGKAELYITMAERRSEEAGKLAEKGEDEHIDATISDINENIAGYLKKAEGIKNHADLDRLRDKLEKGASRTLANIQKVAEKVPDKKRDKTDESLQSLGTTFGKVVETAASRTGEKYAASSPGIIQFWAKDLPSGVEKVEIEIGRIEAHMVAGSDTAWVTVGPDSQVFDLVKLSEAQKFLGEQKVKPGSYTRIKFEVIKVTVLSRGREYEARVPSGTLSIIRPFTVEENKTTSIVLDFNGEKSLRVTGQGEYIFSPVVQALVIQPPGNGTKQDKEKPEKKEKADKSGETIRQQPPAIKTPTSQPKPAQQEKIKATPKSSEPGKPNIRPAQTPDKAGKNGRPNPKLSPSPTRSPKATPKITPRPSPKNSR